MFVQLRCSTSLFNLVEHFSRQKQEHSLFATTVFARNRRNRVVVSSTGPASCTAWHATKLKTGGGWALGIGRLWPSIYLSHTEGSVRGALNNCSTVSYVPPHQLVTTPATYSATKLKRGRVRWEHSNLLVTISSLRQGSETPWQRSHGVRYKSIPEFVWGSPKSTTNAHFEYVAPARVAVLGVTVYSALLLWHQNNTLHSTTNTFVTVLKVQPTSRVRRMGGSWSLPPQCATTQARESTTQHQHCTFGRVRQSSTQFSIRWPIVEGTPASK